MHIGRIETGRLHQQGSLPTQEELGHADHNHSTSSYHRLCAREVLRKCVVQLSEWQDGVRYKFHVRVQALQIGNGNVQRATKKKCVGQQHACTQRTIE
jgi:hypothetical protein